MGRLCRSGLNRPVPGCCMKERDRINAEIYKAVEKLGG